MIVIIKRKWLKKFLSHNALDQSDIPRPGASGSKLVKKDIIKKARWEIEIGQRWVLS